MAGSPAELPQKRRSCYLGCMSSENEISPINQKRLRSLINTEAILKKLQAHVLDGQRLTSTQIRAAEVLLRKVSPDLSAQTIAAADPQLLPVLKIVRASDKAA